MMEEMEENTWQAGDEMCEEKEQQTYFKIYKERATRYQWEKRVDKPNTGYVRCLNKLKNYERSMEEGATRRKE